MLDSDEERWLTYAEAGELLGISSEAARAIARRNHWPRRTPNRPGGFAQVQMPADRLTVRTRPALTDGQMPVADGHSVVTDGQVDRRPTVTNGADQPVTDPVTLRSAVRTLENAVDGLRDQLAVANRRLDEERQRLEEERTRTADAMTAERIAREEAAGLSAELDARKQWGWWRRVRGR
jgi:hypothetical protein